ncbi:MAG: chitosanase [Myxococcales bacterium]|nr:chitosanase [Myxococcales bacterium]
MRQAHASIQRPPRSGPRRCLGVAGALLLALGLLVACDPETSDAHDVAKPADTLDGAFADIEAPDPRDTGEDPGAADAGPPPVDGAAFAFGSHRGQPIANALHVGRPQAELDAVTAAFYDAWKARYIAPGCAAGERRVRSSPATEAFTVSEGQGYGLLAAVMMAGHDPEAQALFDDLFRYAAAHPSHLTPGLMAWAQDEACRDIEGADAATDGDLDIAYALLRADRQWGSDGAIDYAAEARTRIAAILAGEVHPEGTVLLGDWVDPGDAYAEGTRISDFLPGHFAAFAAATGEPRWTAVLDRALAIVAHLQGEHAPATGLLPDFVVDALTDAPAPAPADWLEGAHDGHYGWNACRAPWRLGVYALFSGDARARRAVGAMTRFMREATHEDPGAIRAGYRLDGRAFGDGTSMAFTAPFALAAMLPEESSQAWLDALWAEVAAAEPEEYFGDSIKLLALITLSNNGWIP